VGKGKNAKQAPLVDARVIMPTKQQVRDAGIQNILDAPAVWAAYDAGQIITPLAITDSNGIAVVTSPNSGPDGWAIYVDTEWDDSTTADNASVTDGQISRKVTSGAMQLAVANTDCAPQKHINWVGTVKADGTVDISPARQQHIKGSILTITYAEQALWDGESQLYPFIFGSDSDWTVDICASVATGYSIAGVYDENGSLIASLPCAQTAVSSERTELIMYDVAGFVSATQADLIAHLTVQHLGNVTTLDLLVPGINLTLLDSDGDGWTDVAETVIGTNPLLACGTVAWPADANDDGFSDITDIVALAGSFGRSVPPAPVRYDIAPHPPNGFVDITDIVRMAGFFGRACG
jgi:hypothetical protein